MAYAGLNIIVSRPVWTKRRRSLRERLFSRPWQPLLKEEYILSKPIVAANECMRIGDTLFCGEKFYNELRKATRRNDL